MKKRISILLNGIVTIILFSQLAYAGDAARCTFNPDSLFKTKSLLDSLSSATLLNHGDSHFHDPLEEVEWQGGYTLILTSNKDIASANRTRDFIVSKGGRIAILLPTHAMLGWIPSDLAKELIGKEGIESISYQPVALENFKYKDEFTLAAGSFFNEVVSGNLGRKILNNKTKGTPLTNDSLHSPKINYEDYKENLKRVGIELPSDSTESIAGNSDSMTGTVAVNLFFIESNGATDPNLYTWNSTDQQSTLNSVMTNLSFWSNRAPMYSSSVSFSVSYYSPTMAEMKQPYEPVLRPNTQDSLWIGTIMGNLGYTSGNHFARVTAFNTWLKGYYGTNWSYSMFIGYNPGSAPSTFTNGYFAYAYLGGPYTQLLFRNDGWSASDFGRVATHETGHIFWACDEYYQEGYGGCQSCGVCAAGGPRPTVLNGNCAYCNPSAVGCMMRGNDFSLCSYTPQQIGWGSGVTCPAVTSVSPTSGAAGSIVTITGNNFTGTNQVLFSNNVSASFIVNSNTQITATIPSGAVTGPITIKKTGCTDAQTSTFIVSAGTISVAVGTNPAGLSFTVDGTTYSTTQVFNWTPGQSHTIATTSPQNGGTGTRFIWNRWSDNGTISHTITPTANTTYTTFFDTQYFLTMSAGTGGAVSPASNWYNSGQAVSISATPNSGYSFTSWSGSGAGSYTGSSNPASITMNSPVSETANFQTVGCSYSINPTSRTHPASGDTGSTIAVTAPAGCSWSAISNNFTESTNDSSGIFIKSNLFDEIKDSLESPQAIFNNTSPIIINDVSIANPYPSTINVSGLSGTIANTAGSVKVTLNGFNHTNPDDVGVVLVGPTGAALNIQDGPGDSTGAANLTYTISDTGTAQLPSAGTWASGGIYKPTNYYSDVFPAPAPATYNNPGPLNGGTATFTSTFGGSNPNGSWKLYVVDVITGDVGSFSGGWSLDITTTTGTTNWITVTSGQSGSGSGTVTYNVSQNTGAPRTGTITIAGQLFTVSQSGIGIARKMADFDADGKTDMSIFRPSNGQWWFQQSSDNVTKAYSFGVSTDKIVPADYDGDGKTDCAIFRPSTGEWSVLRSSNGTYYSGAFGISTDKPAPGDFDGDGKADFAVYRQSQGTWYINKSTGGIQITQFGSSQDLPKVADYDGDGRADIGIFRPSGSSGSGEWWILRSTAGLFAVSFGISSDIAVPSDYTGDGKADVAFRRPSTGEWFVLRSENLTYYAAPFGVSTDIPVAGDYDGDGKTDFAVFRPSSATWFVLKSSGGTLIQNFGFGTDIPVPSAYNQ